MTRTATDSAAHSPPSAAATAARASSLTRGHHRVLEVEHDLVGGQRRALRELRRGRRGDDETGAAATHGRASITSSSPAAQRDARQRLAHHALGDQRRVSSVPMRVGMTSTTSAPTSVELGRDRADGEQQVDGGHPARLGRPGARDERGVEHVDVDGQVGRPGPTAAIARRTTSRMPRSRTSCMNRLVIPCSACQPNSSGPGQ